MNGIQNRGRIKIKLFTQIERKDTRGKGDPPIQSQGSEWTPLLSKLLLREEPGLDVTAWLDPDLDHRQCMSKGYV